MAHRDPWAIPDQPVLKALQVLPVLLVHRVPEVRSALPVLWGPPVRKVLRVLPVLPVQ